MVGEGIEVRADTLFGGALVVRQARGGYRFSIDALLLAGLTQVQADDRVVDLGTGCGVVALIFGFRRLGQSVLGLEIQEELAALAADNVEKNGLSDRVTVLQGDFRRVEELLPSQCADLVVSNPPYRRLRSGRVNPDGQRACARHELAGSVTDVYEAGRYLLGRNGRLSVIYPASRLPHLITEAGRCGFAAKRLTVVHSRRDEVGRLVHLECRKGGGEELRVEPPVFIYGDDGSYSEVVRKLYLP